MDLPVRLVVLLSVAHVLAWAVYVGGAITMELVLRHAQDFMKPSQIAHVCQYSGKRYRWWSFFCLVILLATGVPLALQQPGSFDYTTPRGMIVWFLCAVWVVQMGVLALLSFRIHPAMHARLTADMSPEQMTRERQRVGVAIQRMDRTVRTELAIALVAVFAGSALHLDSMSAHGG